MNNSLLLTDFYKTTHVNMYRSDKIASMTSYLTPRGSRLKNLGINECIAFGIQGFSNYLKEEFNKNFFGRDIEEIHKEYIDALKNGLNYSNDMIEETFNKVKELHDLRFLPITIKGLAEGTRVPMGVPMIEITTNPEYPNMFWVGQAIECLLSCKIWHPIVSATIADVYKSIVKEAFDKTVDNGIAERAICDFSMRGQESLESSIVSSAAFLTSFYNSSTVCARGYIEDNYNDYEDVKETINGLTSTEHSVMCSDFAICGDERETYRRLLTEVYPNTSFAAVMDSYDFWNVLTNILPSLRTEIENHNGFLGCRHDSSEPVYALCGDMNKIGDPNRTPEEKGMVEVLWDEFGGTINSKGYKVLNPKVKAVYGDSITVSRARKIYENLEKKGFAASNVSLGVGSFSMEAIEGPDGQLYPFTRDTFSIAIKCTHMILKDGTEVPVFKNPKSFSGKKSQKGLCVVYKDENNKLNYIDYLTTKTKENITNDLLTELYFDNGRVFEKSFNEIRNKLKD